MSQYDEEWTIIHDPLGDLNGMRFSNMEMVRMLRAKAFATPTVVSLSYHRGTRKRYGVILNDRHTQVAVVNYTTYRAGKNTLRKTYHYHA
jgi:ATP-dependent RNA circularization protein (DNA/RNA ligase family)